MNVASGAQARIFLSCVSAEFRGCRELLAKDLRRARAHVFAQEDFGVSGGTLLDKLDRYIQECDAVVHLIGDGTGAVPEAVAVQLLFDRHPDLVEVLPFLADRLRPNHEPMSYSQWEAYLALYHARPLFVYFPASGAPREAGFVATEAERASQAVHFSRIRTRGKDRGGFEDAERLSSHVLADLQGILAHNRPHLDWAPWQAEPPELQWQLANHDGVREAFAQLLSVRCDHRALLLCGPTGHGKSALTAHLRKEAIRLRVRCGRFDFKGATDLGTVLEEFASQMQVGFARRRESPDPIRSGLLAIFEAVRADPTPTLLIFDAFEQSADAVEAWFNDFLFPQLGMECNGHLRVVIAGQKVPEPEPWSVADHIVAAPLSLGLPDVEDWIRFGRDRVPQGTVRLVYRAVRGDPTVMVTLLGGHARARDPAIKDCLGRIQHANGDLAQIARALVHFSLAGDPEPVRAAVVNALEAVAVSHWFTEQSIATLLSVSPERAACLYHRLANLGLTESFKARGQDARNVHEKWREPILHGLANHRLDDLRAIGARAVEALAVADEDEAAVQIERCFCLTLADQERGVQSIRTLNREFIDKLSVEDAEALAAVCDELKAIPNYGNVPGSDEIGMLAALLAKVLKVDAERRIELLRRILACFRSREDPRAVYVGELIARFENAAAAAQYLEAARRRSMAYVLTDPRIEVDRWPPGERLVLSFDLLPEPGTIRSFERALAHPIRPDPEAPFDLPKQRLGGLRAGGTLATLPPLSAFTVCLLMIARGVADRRCQRRMIFLLLVFRRGFLEALARSPGLP